MVDTFYRPVKHASFFWELRQKIWWHISPSKYNIVSWNIHQLKNKCFTKFLISKKNRNTKYMNSVNNINNPGHNIHWNDFSYWTRYDNKIDNKRMKNIFASSFIHVFQACIKHRLGALLHTEKSFLNLVKSNQIWILITLIQLITAQTEHCLELNQSEKSIRFWFDITRFQIEFSVCHWRHLLRVSEANEVPISSHI